MSESPVRLLIVDDEEALMHALCNILQQQGYVTTGCVSAEAALSILKTASFDLLLTDMMMPGTDGLALVRMALAHDPQMVAVVMTGQGSIETAVQAMRSGVLDYVLKPFKLNTMLPVLQRALSVRTLRLENAALQEQILARTHELETANRELEAYAATVSHDLRAPLRGIDGMTQLLAQQLAPVLTPGAQHLIDLIGLRAQRAQRLIEDLLRLSKIGRRPLVCAEVDVGLLAREVVDELMQGAAADGPRVVIAADMPVANADLQLLRQVLANLIGNSLKFARDTPGAVVEVGGRVSNGFRVFQVKDNGPGFDMRQSGKLFMPFERLKGAEPFEGSGVGLSIVQRIVQRHGGHIWVEAGVGKGACFFFTLDTEQVAASDASA
jgi:signal transduction histidine kinase